MSSVQSFERKPVRRTFALLNIIKYYHSYSIHCSYLGAMLLREVLTALKVSFIKCQKMNLCPGAASMAIIASPSDPPRPSLFTHADAPAHLHVQLYRHSSCQESQDRFLAVICILHSSTNILQRASTFERKKKKREIIQFC